jgi:hypothetical protein
LQLQYGQPAKPHSTDLEARKIRRIAVVPPTVIAGASAKRFRSAWPWSRARASALRRKNLARFAYSALVSLPNWQIVSKTKCARSASHCRQMMLVGSNGSAKWFMPTQ